MRLIHVFSSCSICSSVVATTRSSTTQSVLREAVDHVLLVAPNVRLLFLEVRLAIRFERAKRPFIATEESTVDGIVADRERGFFVVRNVDERGVLAL